MLKMVWNIKPPRMMRFLIVMVELVLCVSIIGQGWLLYKELQKGAANEIIPPLSVQKYATSPAPVDFDQLLQFDPFFRRNKKATLDQMQRPAEDAQSIALKGVRYEANGASAAILELNTGSQKVFREGDLVYPGAEVKRIFPERVIVSTTSGSKVVFFGEYASDDNDTAVPELQIRETQLFSAASFSTPEEVQQALREVSIRPSTYGPFKVGLEVVGAKDWNDLTVLGLAQGDILYDPERDSLETTSHLMDLAQEFRPEKSMELLIYRPSEQLLFTLMIG